MVKNNGKKEQGMIIQSLTDIKESMKEMKIDIKNDLKDIKQEMHTINNKTIEQEIKIKNIENDVAENKKNIRETRTSLNNIKLTIAGWGAGAGAAVTGVIQSIIYLLR